MGELAAAEVAQILRDFIDGMSGEWDWDNFTSTPITDPSLEAIRQKALKIDLPANQEALKTLEQLHSAARKLIQAAKP